MRRRNTTSGTRKEQEMFPRRNVNHLFLMVVATGVMIRQTSAEVSGPLYQDDPEILRILAALEDNTGVYLPPSRFEGADMDKVEGFSKRGPNVRDYCNKMVYAPERRTALYCGANHGAPSRLNDVSEYHLGANTWCLLAPPVGGDHGRVNRSMNEIKLGKNVEKNRAFLKEWFENYCELKDGYLQTKGNGGPVCPWHTWDGCAYDASAGLLLWAVLDTDEIHDDYLKAYAEYTGRNFEELKRQRKPGTGLYLFDPVKAVWRRQMGPDPRPYLRGMGGSLTYIPEWGKTIWYCAAQNVSPNDFAMWAYDARANTWTELKPNGGKPIRNLVHVEKVAPGSEVQMAYSPKHRKIVAVLGKDTFVYDLEANAWSKVCEDEQNKASDSATVFAYDSVSDVFLLLNAPKGQWNLERELRSFDLKTVKWETLSPKGEMVQRLPYCGQAGYFDPLHNVFVVYGSTERVWVYRYRKAKDE
ncbi:MAG: hypothetical protein ACUVWX_14180 [Kiritimatiellia bacterium]